MDFRLTAFYVKKYISSNRFCLWLIFSYITICQKQHISFVFEQNVTMYDIQIWLDVSLVCLVVVTLVKTLNCESVRNR